MATLACPKASIAFVARTNAASRPAASAAVSAAPVSSRSARLAGSLSVSAAAAAAACSGKELFSTPVVHSRGNHGASRAVSRGAVRVDASVARRKVLIVNTNGGGHAVIGFALARQLATAGHSVTIMTVGDRNSDKMKKPPFSRFSELRAEGVRTEWGDPARLSTVFGATGGFDVVLDNNGKDLDTVKPVADWASAAGVRQFLFISSAGIYTPSSEPPHVEGDAVKESSGHAQVEKYLAGKAWGDGWAAFRPQYITGSGNNKDCEEWFFDRIVRGRPVPIPSPGIQLTVVAHVDDIARMIALAIDYPQVRPPPSPQDAKGQIFNAVGGRAVTFDGLARMCANAAGRASSLKIVHYDPKAAGVDAKKAFPFRNMHFYSEPRNARERLGFKSFTDLQTVLNQRYIDYVAAGRDKKDAKFEVDDKILASAKALYNVGFWVRETGQALDRLGCRLQGKYAFHEELSRHRTIMNLFDKLPEVPANAFVAPSAAVIGDVQIGQRSSVWYNAILRGDVNSIRVGTDTNIQDGCIVHVAKTNLAGKILPTIIGSRVTVGHNAILHACTVEDEAFVGIGATLLDGVVVESGAMVAAGALVVQNTRIPSGQIWAGSPAKFFRTLTAAERAFIAKSAESYASLAEVHAKENAKSFEEVEADKKQREGWANYSEDFVSSVGAVVDKPPVPGPVKLA
ncbi:unnamed protein product [Closterium sp. Yama58-4]|nr:unnamed protein product [Closterium sp. Yama58-4]